MFFIGPSTNIFVYLLVSAFFVICFYSQSEAMLQETLPGYESVINYGINENESYYCCQTAKKENTISKNELLYSRVKKNTLNIRQYTCFIYKNPKFSIMPLRAPPIT